ncbi:HAD family hydrolase [Clostridium thermarum]|uniref:HAD family hydrolase n=1 Tax=Clostridium thermarum TaxID=1716543 RepID=UPI0013D08817|nr:HAD family phosphatase [Clostridium thermarum]
MIKNIVFDLGNVLISFNPNEYLDTFDFDNNIKEAVFKGIFKSKYWPELDRGTVTEEEALECFCKDAPEVAEEIRAVMASWKDILLPIPETIGILRELKEKGYKLFALSNYHRAAFEKTSSENEFFQLFDGKVISYEIQTIKPEKEIYEHLLKIYNLKAEETLFIDDMVENIEGAKRLGINTHIFKGPEGLRAYLRELKIL